MTEAPEPGGVNWITRKSSPAAKSASSRHPRLASNALARSTSETGITTTSSFMSAVRAFGVSIDAMIIPPPGSLDDREERLPFLDDVRGALRRVAAAEFPRRVDR